MSKKNPISAQDKQAKRLEPELETDKFGSAEQTKICDMIIKDAAADTQVMANWLTDNAKDIAQYECEKPSILENLKKKTWQSDRNLGLCPAVVDTYQAVLLATVYNPTSIHAVATEKNDIDNKENYERFCKWMVGPQEMNFESELDDYIHNKLVHGFSAFYIHW